MDQKKKREVEQFVQVQKAQLGLSDQEVENLLQEAMAEDQSMEAEEDLDIGTEYEPEEISDPAFEYSEPPAAAPPPHAAAAQTRAAAFPPPRPKMERKKAKRKDMSDPYLPQSQTIKARPTRVSRIRSLLFEHALPNEYIVQIGQKDLKPVLGGRFFKIGKRFLKFPAAVQTVYFTSDNANKNYQGLKIDGYACWRIDPDRPEIAAKALDFSDQDNPMGNTNRILRTICTEAIRHIIANITIEDALTKKDEIGRDLKAQLERIERTWGVAFDQVGIERVTILSAKVFDDLQQKTRDQLRLTAAESRMSTDREIEIKKAEHGEELARLRAQAEKEARILRATTESEIHKIEIDEQTKRDIEERRAEEERLRAEAEAEERRAAEEAERLKREASRAVETEAHQEAEKRRLELLRIQAEAEANRKSAEIEAETARAVTQSEMLKAQAEYERQIKDQELADQKETLAREARDIQESARQRAHLQRQAEQFTRQLAEAREKAEVDHLIGKNNLERLKVQREIENNLSDNKVLADLVGSLPEAARAMNIDQYTVFDSNGGSPLTHLAAQLFSLFKDYGSLGKAEAEQESDIQKAD